jgi:hypothetical protein
MAMMFLQFFIWGSWYATGGNYMKSHHILMLFISFTLPSNWFLVSPFFLGMIADRFAVEK